MWPLEVFILSTYATFMRTIAFLKGNPSKDYTKARHWLEIAARQDTLRGAGEAMFNLGSMCLEGMGCPANIAKALRWFQLAGSCEHAEALGTLNKVRCNNLFLFYKKKEK